MLFMFYAHILLVMMFALIPGTSALMDFLPSHTYCTNTPDGLCQVTKNLNLSKVSSPIVALGDWSGDKYTDLIMLDQQECALQVHSWVREKKEFTAEQSMKLTPKKGNMKNTDCPVVAVEARDFNFDGLLDALVTEKKPKSGVTLSIYLQNESSGLLEAAPIVTLDADDQVLVAELVQSESETAVEVDLYGSFEGKRQIWKNSLQNGGGFNRTSFNPAFDVAAPTATPAYLCPRSPSSIVDVNGDCKAELVSVLCTCAPDAKDSPDCEKRLEFVSVGAREEHYGQQSILKNIRTLKGLGVISWGDFDGDGAIDMIAPVEYQNKWNHIVVLYNKQEPGKCANVELGTCCDAGFDFPELGTSSQNPADIDMADVVIYSLDSEGKSKKSMMPKTSYTDNEDEVPPTIRVGDFNIDGYPDIMVIVQEEGENLVKLFKNEKCTAKLCGEKATASGRRSFAQETKNVKALKSDNIVNPIGAFWFTVDEEGQNDIIIMTKDSDSKATHIHAIKNNFFNDAFFFKASGTNGAKGPHTKRYGAGLPGTTVKFSWGDLGDKGRVATGALLPSSAYFSLHPPYNFFGLGRTNSYIEKLSCGIYNGGNEYHKEWLGLIPNSRVYVFPEPFHTATGWVLELYISPSQTTTYVALAVIGGLILLAFPILYLHQQEKREDEAAKAVLNF